GRGGRKGTPFRELAQTLEKVRLTKGKNEKVSILAGLLSRLESEDEAEHAARFAAGRSTRKGSADETQVGYSSLVGVLRDLTGVTQEELSRSYLKYGDLSESLGEFIGRRREATLFDGAEDALTILEVASTFEKITEAQGKGSTAMKKELVKSLLRRGESELEAKYIVKILSKEMRIGLVEGLVEEAVAEAFAKDQGREKVKEAYLMLGDIGLLAREAKGGRLAQVRVEPMRPTNFMLAEPMASAEEISSYFEGRELFAEYKYDGVRAQVHKRGGEVKIFSRRLEEITRSFPEVFEAASLIPHDVVLDGEIVAFREGEGPLSFQLIQRRLRRADVEESKRIAPIRYYCFDILYLDGSPVHRESFRARRELLWGVLERTSVRRADSRTVRSGDEIQAFFRESRSLGYEGLVLKDPESPYTPGRRGRYWAKLKEELDTLDVVMVAAEFGHGKRAGKISDYTFAVRDGDQLKVIGKAYSGLTDKEIEETMVRIKRLAVGEVGFRMAVRPEIVLEVAFDSIQKSDRHDSGYALRFPRIKAIRDDRSLADIDTLNRVREIYDGQKVKADVA
ncbi:MAG TPA: ATP-dependent DNA ligase, partial [Nitrososphaerales archaeon]|nr:ATP-dependent DNA ligase [Nitrososphaerales archaeon]